MSKARKKPLVSIITASLNSEKTIEQTIQSVLNQTYKNIQYIIIDGLSTDRTNDVVAKYRKEIDIHISEKDNGLYHAFNKGISLAKGEIIGILNSDDFYDTNSIDKVVSAYETYGDKKIYFGNMGLIDEKSNLTGTRIINHNSYFFMRSGQSIPHPTVFVPKKIYTKFGVFDTSYKIAADYDLLFRYLFVNKIKYIYIESTLTFFRVGGVSSNFFPLAFENYKIRVNNNFSKIVSALYLLKSILFHVFSLTLKKIGLLVLVNFYREKIIKSHKY